MATLPSDGDALALFRLRLGVMPLLGACAAAGLPISLRRPLPS